MKLFKKAIEISVVCFMSFLVIFSAYTYIASENSNTSYLFGIKPVLVYTDQMSPDLEKNSIAIVKKTHDFKVGDIIAYVYQDKYTTHKLKSINTDNTLVTESNKLVDTYSIKREDVDGVVVCKINMLNKIITDIRENILLGIIIVVSKVIRLIFILLLLKSVAEYILVKKGFLEYEEVEI